MYEYSAKYIKNWDGDTITVLVDCGFNITHIIILRLSGVDTYEIRSKIAKDKKKALEAKELVKEKLSNAKSIKIKTFKDKKGKYGRYLAEVFFSNTGKKFFNLKNLLMLKGLTTGKYE